MGKFGINYKIPEEWEQAYEDLSYAGQRSARPVCKWRRCLHMENRRG